MNFQKHFKKVFDDTKRNQRKMSYPRLRAFVGQIWCVLSFMYFVFQFPIKIPALRRGGTGSSPATPENPKWPGRVWKVGCIEKLKNGLFNMPDSNFYGI